MGLDAIGPKGEVVKPDSTKVNQNAGDGARRGILNQIGDLLASGKNEKLEKPITGLEIEHSGTVIHNGDTIHYTGTVPINLDQQNTNSTKENSTQKFSGTLEQNGSTIEYEGNVPVDVKTPHSRQVYDNGVVVDKIIENE